MTHHRINIKLRGCNEFVEKFPGGSPEAAKSIARSRYPDAIRIEWKGTCRSDAEEAKWEQQKQDYRDSVQETYDRQSAQTAANWEHQRQLDAQHANGANNSYNPSTGDSGGGGGCLILLLVGMVGAVTLVGGAGSFMKGFCRTSELCGNETKSSPVRIQERTNIVDQTPEEVNHRWSRSNDPCAIWANANPALAAQLQPGDRCWGF